jgi:hypothetical protein
MEIVEVSQGGRAAICQPMLASSRKADFEHYSAWRGILPTRRSVAAAMIVAAAQRPVCRDRISTCPQPAG